MRILCMCEIYVGNATNAKLCEMLFKKIFNAHFQRDREFKLWFLYRGHFGLWLDEDLYRGRSVTCQTYNNDPLASSDDFIVKTLEAWGLA